MFDALARAGITSVIVQFDGYGDSGQIESVEAVPAMLRRIPSGPDGIRRAVFCGGDRVERSTHHPADAIENLVYDVLEETHGGWENNDGAYGDFTFDVGKRTITLDYNERHMESDYSVHIF